MSPASDRLTKCCTWREQLFPNCATFDRSLFQRGGLAGPLQSFEDGSVVPKPSYNQRVQATPGSALGKFVATWPGAPDPGRSAKTDA